MTDNQDYNIEGLRGFIIQLAKKNNISAYELGKKSSISASSVNKIFSGENKTPKIKTLLKLQDDLEKAIAGTKGSLELQPDYQSKVAETPVVYNKEFTGLKIDEKLNIIYQQNLKQEKTLEILSSALGGLLLDFEEAEILKSKQKS